MDVNETAVLKKLMDGEGEPAADTEDRAEQIRARPKVRDLAEKLRRVTLLLERIRFVGCADDFDFVRDHFPGLAFSLRGNQIAADHDRRAGLKPLDLGIIRERAFRDDLETAQGRAVVQFDERKVFRVSPGPDPALDLNAVDRRGARQRGFYGNKRSLGHHATVAAGGAR